MKKLIGIAIIFLCFAAAFAEPPEGYSSIEDYTLTYFKKLNKTQEKLTYMHKKSSLAKVGTETVNGGISGTLFYDVKIKGLGAVVTLRYTNYCDEEGWIYDGEIITHSNMAQNGEFSGTIKVSGVSPAEVCYDNVIMQKGSPADGFYLLTLPGTPPAKMVYTLYLESTE
ncbi:MAG: hypothetical protein IKQ84_05545 [Spirochaetaceae bacterium]|nr:hypothetical protein [Spirochaetaceae bacterium]